LHILFALMSVQHAEIRHLPRFGMAALGTRVTRA